MKETLERQLELLVTEHCSLCDRAFDLLASSREVAGWRLKVQDVVYDDALFDKYAESVPVLIHGQRALLWPFDHDELRVWLAEGLSSIGDIEKI